jgi:AraC-like DNA-binding protein
MAPRAYSTFLPKTVSVLRTSKLLVAALDSVPEDPKSVPAKKLKLLREIIKCELQSAECESLAVTLPRSIQLAPLVDTLLDHAEDPRSLDQWAKKVGMSRRTFTRKFMDETGSTFGQWRNALLLGKALDLLSEGHSVSETSHRLGYSGPSAFVAAFRTRFGVSPGKFFEPDEHRSP